MKRNRKNPYPETPKMTELLNKNNGIGIKNNEFSLNKTTIDEKTMQQMGKIPDITEIRMLHRTFCGIDNGVSGGITILNENGSVLLHQKTPVKKCLNYTKKKAFINRINIQELQECLIQAGLNTFCMIERPMVNPGRFAATISAMRCMEATEIILEQLQIPYQWIDSKEWQKELLPSGLKGDELKLAAAQVAKRLYPKLKVENADCLLIALYCKRKMS